MIRSHVLICGGTGCTSSGSVKIQQAFEENLSACGILEEVKIVEIIKEVDTSTNNGYN